MTTRKFYALVTENIYYVVIYLIFSFKPTKEKFATELLQGFPY